jgi:predicted O-methyltransferase YrrM
VARQLDFRSRKQILSLLIPIVGIGALAIYFAGIWGLGLLAVLLCGVVLMALRDVLDVIFKVRHEVEVGTKRLEAASGLFASLPLKATLPPLQGAVISPDFANLLVNLLYETEPLVVLELGSGVSTTITASVLRELGQGHLFSVDNDAKYRDITLRTLRTHGVAQWVTLILAPIKSLAVGGRSFPWYDLDLAVVPPEIDLLVVDGPPAMEIGDARYPALPILMPKLSDRAIVIIDDYDRAGDRANVQAWRQLFPDFDLEEYETEKGTAILRRRASVSTPATAVVEQRARVEV